MYPTEKAKYEGIGGAVLTTGLLAFLSGFYAIYSTIASGAYSILTAIGFGVLWGLAIFNLDRYIVASLRKPTDPDTRWRRRLVATWLPALPRIGLAVLIAITLSKPLELRLFNNAIARQAELNRDRAVTAKRTGLTQSSRLNELTSELNKFKEEIAESENHARSLEDEFRKESDGTGGSRRYGYSEVARVKEAAAIQARQQADQTRNSIQERVTRVQAETDSVTADIEQQVDAFRRNLRDDFLTKMAALSELSANSTAVWWISAFITFLLIGIEITPVVVKLLSPIGPYDVKLDALNSAETHEARLKRDTSMGVATYHYELAERAERQADDQFLAIRTALVADELDRKTRQWKAAKAAGGNDTIEKLVGDVRTEILTLRQS